MGIILNCRQSKSDEITIEHTLADQECSLGEENTTDETVGSAQGFEGADQLHAVQDQNDQSRDNIETRHKEH